MGINTAEISSFPLSTLNFEYTRLNLHFLLSTADFETQGHTIRECISKLARFFAQKPTVYVHGKFKHLPQELLLPKISPEDLSAIAPLRAKAMGRVIPWLTKPTQLQSHIYVLRANGDLKILDIPSDPADTIAPRSSREGRIVHPALCDDTDLRVYAAGEVACIQNQSTGMQILVINACSGHYRPSRIDASEILDIFRGKAPPGRRVEIVAFGRDGCAISQRLAPIIGA